MMAASRDVAIMDREIRAGTWQPREGAQLRGKTLGLIGLGGIGREVARIAAGIGMKVIAWNRTQRDHSDIEMTRLDDVLARADILSMHLTLGDETRDFLDAERLARTKKGVILVNTARGAVIDETALLEALRSGHIRHAALDVFHDEPLPVSNPLTKLANDTLTAHAGFRTPDSLMTLFRRAIDLAQTGPHTMTNYTFSCIDGHTCGNPVRLVSGGAPILKGATMSERRLDFLARFDWIRKALMFEPRGHDVMSGSMLYPPLREDCDAAILFIEVSGCLPMCGHGTIGTVTMALENGLARSARGGPGRARRPGRPRRRRISAQWSIRRQGPHLQRRLVPRRDEVEDRLPRARRAGLRRVLRRQLLRHHREAEEFRASNRSLPTRSCA